MKRILIALVLILGFTFSSFAQSFGIKGGYSLSNLSTSSGDIEKDNARHGFVLGVVANYPAGIFSIQPEILYTQKGADYNSFSVGVKSKLDYIEIPLSLQLNLLDPFYFYAGPQLSYLLRSEVEYSLGNSNVVVDNDESNSNRVDLGGVIGLGFKLNSSFIDARISKGFIDYDKDRTIEGIEYEAKNLQNFNFQLTTGLMF